MSQHGLLSLPDTILRRIVASLDARHDLGVICRINRRLNAIADPLLYTDIRFKRPERHVTFLESLTNRPRRGSFVRNLLIQYASSRPSKLSEHETSKYYPLDCFSYSISTMTNLLSLIIHAPETLSTGIGYLFNGPFDLPNLKSCTLFYECGDRDYWDLRKNIHVFSHPVLEHLVIRRARLDSDGLQLLEKPERTALQTLQLLECDISENGFYDIMTCPRALKEITFTQTKLPGRPLKETSNIAEDYVSALKLAENSLKKIVIDFPSLKSKRPMQLGRYNRLVRLELYDYQLFSLATPRSISISLPPNLKTLKFFNQVGLDRTVAELLSHTIRNKDIWTNTWNRMIVEDIHLLPPEILRACDNLDGFLAEEKPEIYECENEFENG